MSCKKDCCNIHSYEKQFENKDMKSFLKVIVLAHCISFVPFLAIYINIYICPYSKTKKESPTIIM